MDTTTQLTPVQAWLIGAIDQATLRDLLGNTTLAQQYGRTLTDRTFAASLLNDAQEAIGT
jgi:hypothetical protein